jgi:hypothetical protein
MPTKPPAPDGLPKSLHEGIPKQGNEELRAVQKWIDELIEYRQDVSPSEIEAGDGESINTVEETSSGTVVIRKNTCGSEGCKCQNGELHGPYKYVVTRNGDSLNWEYKGPVDQGEG